jgi:hypothetical protein
MTPIRAIQAVTWAANEFSHLRRTGFAPGRKDPAFSLNEIDEAVLYLQGHPPVGVTDLVVLYRDDEGLPEYRRTITPR